MIRLLDDDALERSPAVANNAMNRERRRRRVGLRGRREVAFPHRCRGADGQVGPNHTGQPAVASFYADENGSRPRKPSS
ncbi:hypothetical protein [Actinomadura kijaniata]|uniref:hypothetical protein n=1 Tax=Actinomadura kijaniata TaxID=46161 RepID=UPI00082A4D3A|nr:hypothetical protein [Actinomadura kijaniata]